MKPSYSEAGGLVLTPDFGKSDVHLIVKQSAIGVFVQSINMEADVHWQLLTRARSM